MFSPQGDGQAVIAFLLFHCVKHCGMYRGLKAPNLEQLRFKMKVKEKVTQSSPILCYPMDYTWNSPGQNTGAVSLSLLQGIFPTQGLNPGLLHCRQILYQLSHQGSPRILEWGASPFSRGSS